MGGVLDNEKGEGKDNDTTFDGMTDVVIALTAALFSVFAIEWLSSHHAFAWLSRASTFRGRDHEFLTTNNS